MNPCELCYVNVFLPLMKQQMRNHFNRRANGVEAEIYFSEVSRDHVRILKHVGQLLIRLFKIPLIRVPY